MFDVKVSLAISVLAKTLTPFNELEAIVDLNKHS